MLAAAQCGFVNEILKRLPRTAPGVNPGLVVATGATELNNTFSAEQLSGILLAYMKGIKLTFAITVAALGISFLISTTSNWKRINAEKLSGGAA